MKSKKIVAVVIIALLTGISTKAQDYKTALGIRISSNAAVINNSVSFRYFFKETSALEALVSFDPVAAGALFEKFNLLGPAGLSWFYGGGIYVGFSQGKNLGAQGIVGLDYKLQAIPINVSVDWKPELNLIKDVFFEPAAIGVSVRFTFN
jgi:hypothetical protein